MMKFKTQRAGFTLVELILFTGIISIMAGTLIGFSLVSSNIAVHNEVVSEVEQNGDIVLQRILRTAQEGGRIAYPLSNQAGNELLITSGNPEKEILFYLHGDRIAMVEDGSASYLSTGNVTFDSLSFLHYGTPEEAEGLSVVFRAKNTAAPNNVSAGQYSKIFRGTITLPPGGCTIDADCATAPFTTCCSGLCRPSCQSCTSHSDCPANQVCCVESGTATCKAAGSCATPQCDDVADCPVTAPSCDLAACNYKVPTCNANVCGLTTVGVCPSCSYCGDGRYDPMKNEECDDGDAESNDACTVFCRRARCGDGAVQALGANGAVGGGDDEQCDDGNTGDDDGCSATCQDENLCSGARNGIREGDEECDDGNAAQTDACDNFCRITACGDGITQTPNGHGQTEECDDGNTFTGDLCSPACLTVTADECGNGIEEGSEECDDGRRCTSTGEQCQFDDDCPGASNLCRGSNIDGCTTPQACTPTETPESTCNDAIDNDCDNLIDCADTVNCPNGTSCGANGRQCSGGTCACPGGEANEATCGDTLDNDCDGTVDCADSDCNGDTCDTGKTCQSGSCEPSGGGGNQCSDTLDNDGDLLTDCMDPGCVSVSDWVKYSLPPNENYGAADFKLTDLDGDSDLDIVFARGLEGLDMDMYGDLHWFESDGALPPSFTRRDINIGFPDTPFVDVGLVNDDDAHVDIVGGGWSDLYWYKNNGSESFTRYQITITIPAFPHVIKSVHLVDWNSDGQKDILVFHGDDTAAGGANVYQNNGSESFTEIELVSGVPVFSGYPGDFDSDGKLDVLLGDTDSLDWYRNIDNSTVPFPLQETLDTGYFVLRVLAANLDNDSDLDVIAGEGSGVHWYQNSGGSFTPKTDINALSSLFVRLAAGDIDEDSDVDVIASNNQFLYAYLSSGGANPTFSAGQSVDTVNSYVSALWTGDLKDNGDIVLIVTTMFGEYGAYWYDDVGSGQCYPLDDSEAI